MTSDKTQKNLDVGPKFVPFINFDRYVRRRLVINLKVHAEHNKSPDGSIDFAALRREINEWLSTQAVVIRETNKRFPDRLHEKFFSQLCPTGSLDDIVTKLTYSKNTLLLHVLAYYLDATPYTQFSIRDLFATDIEFEAAISYLEFTKSDDIQPLNDLCGVYEISTDVLGWKFDLIPGDDYFGRGIKYDEKISHRDGSEVRIPSKDNKRLLGRIWLTETIDPLIYKATFVEDRNGKNGSRFSGMFKQTRYAIIADMVDRRGRLAHFTFGYTHIAPDRTGTDRPSDVSFSGGFSIFGTRGDATISKIGNIDTFYPPEFAK